MTEFEVLTAQRQELLNQLAEAQKAYSDAKPLRRGDERKRVNQIEKQLKENKKLIDKAQKYEYFETGLEKGIDVRANQTNAIANVTKEVAGGVSAVMNPLMGENGMFSKGAVGKMEQRRFQKAGDKALGNKSSVYGMSNNMLIFAGFGLLVVLLIFKRK